MTEKKVLIIGSGMAGLAAGCYGQMNGYQTEIFEMHDIPGGLCTAWQRRGYTFDISIHMLTGSRSGSIHRIWQELGVVQGRRFVHHDEGPHIKGDDGRTFIAYADLDRLHKHMLALSPDDAGTINRLIRDAKQVTGVDVGQEKPSEFMTFFDYVRMFAGKPRFFWLMYKYGKTTLQEYVRRFRDPFLGEAFRLMIDSNGWPMPDFPMGHMLMVLAMAQDRNLEYPIGGSFGVSQTITQRYLDLGGQFHFNALVEKILVEKGRAVGLRLADGSEQRGDVIISAADGRTTIWQMLDGQYLSDEIRTNYATWRVYPPLIQVMLGVARDLSDEPYAISLPLSEPIVVAGETRLRMDLRHYCFDPTMAPPGKSVVQVWYSSNWDYWSGLANDPERYAAEKQQIADITIAELEKHWPGLSDQVEVVDVPTPLTYHRYTGNWQGSPDGWCVTTLNALKEMPKTLPGLDKFYMAGQWTVPFSGVPGAAISARHVIQMLCKTDGKQFVTSLPPEGWQPVVRAAVPEQAEPAAEPVLAAHAAISGNGTGSANGHEALRVVVDAEKCQGCGDCVEQAPTVFALDTRGIARVLVAKVPAQAEAAVRRAQETCPDGAIQFVNG